MGKGKVSFNQLLKMAQGDNNGDDSEKLLNAPWQRYENGNQVSPGATLSAAEKKIQGNSFETGVLVDKDGFVVAAYKGGRSSVSFGNEPASKFKGAIMTHNHPSGSSFFSVADLATPAVYAAEGGKPRGVRVTTENNGTVSITAVRQDADWGKLAMAYNKAQSSIINDWLDHGDSSSIANAGTYFHNWFRKNATKYGFRFKLER